MRVDQITWVSTRGSEEFIEKDKRGIKIVIIRKNITRANYKTKVSSTALFIYIKIDLLVVTRQDLHHVLWIFTSEDISTS